MKKIIALSVVIVMLLTSCEKRKSPEATVNTEVTVKPSEIEVTINLTETTVKLKLPKRHKKPPMTEAFCAWGVMLW